MEQAIQQTIENNAELAIESIVALLVAATAVGMIAHRIRLDS